MFSLETMSEPSGQKREAFPQELFGVLDPFLTILKLDFGVLNHFLLFGWSSACLVSGDLVSGEPAPSIVAALHNEGSPRGLHMPIGPKRRLKNLQRSLLRSCKRSSTPLEEVLMKVL